MRSTLKRGVGIVAVLAVMVACDRGEQAVVPEPFVRTVKAKDQDTVTITANCAVNNQVDVALSNWVVDIKKKGEVSFAVVSNSTPAAVVTIEQKSAELWPFDEAPPFSPGNGNGQAKGKAKDKNGKYQYNLRVVCGTGTATRTVLIDPDIFVD
jgi:hypothetical protein